eukprot:GHVU01127018.1.p1 GENE.GHVU01127018.1~~GHVU01127018.1.p1  ORF type:complete len:120 (-),score=10.03 GHVU01127018.1:424-783(-)
MRVGAAAAIASVHHPPIHRCISITTGWCPPTPPNHNSGRSVGSDMHACMHPSCMHACRGVLSASQPATLRLRPAEEERGVRACEVAAAGGTSDGSLDPRKSDPHKKRRIDHPSSEAVLS